MKRDLYSDVTARILQSLEAGAVPWKQTWKNGATSTASGLSLPINAATNRPYSGVNVLLLWMSADEGTPRYLTFNQAKEAGGNVRKGEHGRKVYFFKPLTVKDKASGEDKQIPLLREYTVFNVAQCENLPESVMSGKITAPLNQHEREDAAEQFIRSTGADFREGMGKPCYIPSRDIVSMPSFAAFRTQTSFYSVAFHELLHWTGAKHRLDRDFSGRFGTRAYAAEELVAELGAAFINAEFGFDEEVQNAAYLATWIQLLKDDSRAIFTAASKASKAAEFLRGLALADEPVAIAA
jgi:antirestriction protein ArdC